MRVCVCVCVVRVCARARVCVWSTTCSATQWRHCSVLRVTRGTILGEPDADLCPLHGTGTQHYWVSRWAGGRAGGRAHKVLIYRLPRHRRAPVHHRLHARPAVLFTPTVAIAAAVGLHRWRSHLSHGYRAMESHRHAYRTMLPSCITHPATKHPTLDRTDSISLCLSSQRRIARSNGGQLRRTTQRRTPSDSHSPADGEHSCSH